MKKILSLLTIILVAAVSSYSQAPGIFNYQGVARNSVGNVLANKSISLRLTIHDGTAAGPTVYQESRTVITNPFGLFNVQVGSPGATGVTGNIPGVAWGVGAKYIQVEIDPNGGAAFINIGTAQLASVPYALLANSAMDLILPFNKTQADAGTLFKITNSNTTSAGATSLEGLTNSTANSVSAIIGTVTSVAPGGFSAGVRGINNGTAGLGIGVYGSQNGSGWGVYGTTPSGIGVNGGSTSGIGVNGLSTSGIGVLGTSTSGAGVSGTSSTSNAGSFFNTNAANAAATVLATTNGTGSTGVFSNTNAANNAPTVSISQASTNNTALAVSGPGIWGSAIGITNTTTGMEWRTSVNGTTYTVTKVPGATFSPFTLLSDGQVEFPSTAGATRLRILDNGNVGVGITTPTHRLEVQGIERINATTLQEGGELRFQEGTLFGAPNHWIIDNFQSFAGGNKFRLWNDVGGMNIQMMPGGKTAIGNMVFSDQPQSTLDVEGNLAVGATYSGTTAAPANGAIIEGSVGIGTTNPGTDKVQILQAGATGNGLFVNKTNAANTSFALSVSDADVTSAGFFNGGVFSSKGVGGATVLSGQTSIKGVARLAGGVGVNGGSGPGGIGVAGVTSTGIGVVGLASAPGGYGLVTVGQVQIQGQGAALNRILTSDAIGNATWQNPALVLGGLFWSTTGNAATVDGTNFIGTTDLVPFNIRVANAKAGRIDLNANTAYGLFSLNASTNAVLFNSAFGYNSLPSNTTGDQNVGIGVQASRFNTTGRANTSVGTGSNQDNIIGDQNTALGNFAMHNNTGSRNTALGTQALNNSTTGVQNTGVGQFALAFNETGDNNTALGYFATVIAPGLSNATAIGANAQVSASNSLVLGNGANVGIGTTAPFGKFHVSSGNAFLAANLEGSSNVGTWLSLGNTDPGGRWFNMVSTATANGEGPGKLVFFQGGGPNLVTGAIMTLEHSSLNVGIGTTSPFVKFHVNSGNNLNTSLLEAQDANNAGPHQYFYSGGEFGIVDYIRTDYLLDPNRLGALEVRGVNRLNLSPTNSVDMLGGMTIISNGNVGIGQPTPTARFEVQNAGANGSSIIEQNNVANGSNALLVRNRNLAVNNSVFAGNSISSIRGTGGTVTFFANPTSVYGATSNIIPNGIGVTGYGDLVGVSGISGNNGYALYGVSTGTGYALFTSGKVQISGQGAAAGSVLTSDAVGNATWQNLITPAVGISIRNLTAPQSIPTSILTDITTWASVVYEDGGANFNGGTGEYTITVAGLYHIYTSVDWLTFTNAATVIASVVLVNGVSVASGFSNQVVAGGLPSTSQVTFETKLNIGDVVKVQAYQTSGVAVQLNNTDNATRFTVRLIK